MYLQFNFYLLLLKYFFTMSFIQIFIHHYFAFLYNLFTQECCVILDPGVILDNLELIKPYITYVFESWKEVLIVAMVIFS